MRNEHTLQAILDALARNCGDALAACKTVGVSLLFLNQWCKDDPLVKERVDEATQVGAQGLISEAIRRGVTGYEKPVYYKGHQVDTEVVYSDSLLGLLLKAKGGADFKADNPAPQVQVNIANLMPRASNYEEWLAMKEQTTIDGSAEVLDTSGERSNVVEMKAITRQDTETLPDLLAPVLSFKDIDL